MKEILEDFAHFAEESGFTVMGDYSGRGMFGHRCFALVGDESPLAVILRFLTEQLDNAVYYNAYDDEKRDKETADGDGGKTKTQELCMLESDYDAVRSVMELLQHTMRWDDMGRQAVFYWPDIDYSPSDGDDN